ncbi:MAG: transcriptional repressor LexA [Clostridia bacterium]|nr:transcriptional repressor LexA [Clostridia bacterium]
MKKLTKSQQKVYDYLFEHKDDGIAPSVREICSATGFKSTSTVHNHLNSLERLGYITRRPDCARAIFINDVSGKPKFTLIPIIGTVTAGKPIFAFEESLGYVAVEESLKRERELFALTVKGDSMINAGIHDQDVVVFMKTSRAHNGDIVVALIDDEATVKRFFKENGNIRLQPENPMYEPIIITQESENMRILGKVLMLQRYYE